jgi:hypothetical protein
MDYLIRVLRFEICGTKVPPTEDMRQIVEDVFKYRANRVLGTDTTIKFVEFHKGSFYVDAGMVTLISSALDIILNYKPFKESLKELIYDLQKFLKILFQAESVKSIEKEELMVEYETGYNVFKTEKSIEEMIEQLKESKVAVLSTEKSLDEMIDELERRQQYPIREKTEASSEKSIEERIEELKTSEATGVQGIGLG